MANVIAGIAFPFQAQGQGLPKPAFGTDLIRSALIVLVRTKKRSRVMNPDVGTNLHRLIFEDEGPVLRTLILRELSSAIASQLPMVTLVSLDFKETGKVVQVNVKYTIQGILDQTGFVEIS